MLKGKTVLLGVTGSIAAYKIAILASMLVKQGVKEHVLMTRNAANFINPITFESLTGNKCLVAKNLRLSAMQILTAFALLIPAFSLLYTPQPLALLFHRVYNAPLPNTLLYCLSFGVRFSPVKFSAQRRSTSELLRTL